MRLFYIPGCGFHKTAWKRILAMFCLILPLFINETELMLKDTASKGAQTLKERKKPTHLFHVKNTHIYAQREREICGLQRGPGPKEFILLVAACTDEPWGEAGPLFSRELPRKSSKQWISLVLNQLARLNPERQRRVRQLGNAVKWVYDSYDSFTILILHSVVQWPLSWVLSLWSFAPPCIMPIL